MSGRFGGFRVGRKRYLDNWDTLKSENVAAPETIQDLDYTKAKGIWNLKSTMQFPKIASFDPESGLTLTSSFSVGAIAAANLTPNQNAVFACELTWPGTFNSNGLIFEAGGTGTGSGVGLISSGATLRVHAGDGGSDPGASTSTAYVDIAATNFIAGSSGTLAWDYRINPGRVRVWWKGTLLGTGDTSSGGALESNLWSGGDNGSFNNTVSGLVNALTNGSFPGTLDSSLRYYQNQLVLI